MAKSKQVLKSEAMDFKRMIQAFLNANVAIYPIKDKTNNFLDSLINFLDDDANDEISTDGLHNTTEPTSANLKYLLSLFTKDVEQIDKNEKIISNPELQHEIDKTLTEYFVNEVHKLL